MPNHITNIISVRGKAERRKALFEAVCKEGGRMGSLDFEKIIPMPAHIFRGDLGQSELEKYGKNNWYEFMKK